MTQIRIGDLIAERWEAKRRLGEGRFAEVFEVLDVKAKGDEMLPLALKIDRNPEVKTVKGEYGTLRRLQAGCRQVVRVHDAAKHAGRWLMTMELLGPNLAAVRRSTLGGRMDATTAKLIGAQLLNALEALHREGYVHRDVKPANFSLSPPSASPADGTWVLIDFGLARRFVDDAGAVLPERPDAPFRGSTSYASVPIMEQRDQGRRDDLWSWLYILVELLDGGLPWRAPEREGGTAGGGGGAASGSGGAADTCGGAATTATERSKGQVLAAKQQCIANPGRLFSSVRCPTAIRQISAYLATLDFGQRPDYAHLRSLLRSLDEEPLEGDAAAPAPADAEAVATAAGSQAGQGAPTAAASTGAQQPQQLHQWRQQQHAHGSLDTQGAALVADVAQYQELQVPEPAAMDKGQVEPASEPAAAGGAGESIDTRQQHAGEQPRERLRSGSRDRDRRRSRSPLGDGGRVRRQRSSSRDPDRRRSRSRRRSDSRGRRGADRDRERRRSRSRSGRRSRTRSRDRQRQRRSRTRSRERRRSRTRSRSPGRRGGRHSDGGSQRESREYERERERERNPGREREREQRPQSAVGEVPQPGPSAAGAAAAPAAADRQPPRAPERRPPHLDAPDTAVQYRSALDYVFAMRQGALSEAGHRAAAALRELPPAEALGLLCLLMDDLANGTDPRHGRDVAAALQELAAFATGSAHKAAERAAP